VIGALSRLTRPDTSGRATTNVISFWRLPVFGHKLPNVPAFLVPTLPKMATQLADTRLGYRISYERAHARGNQGRHCRQASPQPAAPPPDLPSRDQASPPQLLPRQTTPRPGNPPRRAPAIKLANLGRLSLVA